MEHSITFSIYTIGVKTSISAMYPSYLISYLNWSIARCAHALLYNPHSGPPQPLCLEMQSSGNLTAAC